MTETRRYTLLAAGGSLALMLGALAFQHIGGLAPCQLCIWQRYPHVFAILIGAFVLVLPLTKVSRQVLLVLGGLAALATAALGGFHTGVERGWWEGPSTCSAADTSGLSADDLLAQIMSAPVISCTDVPWQMLGLSMASWNMLASLMFAVVWWMALRRA